MHPCSAAVVNANDDRHIVYPVSAHKISGPVTTVRANDVRCDFKHGLRELLWGDTSDRHSKSQTLPLLQGAERKYLLEHACWIVVTLEPVVAGLLICGNRVGWDHNQT